MFQKILLRKIHHGYIWSIVFVVASWLGSPGIHADSLELTSVRLQLKWKHQFQFAGYYAAVEQGFYRDAGLNVEIIEAHGTESSSEIVLSGRAEFGIAMSDLVLLKAQKQPVVALAAIYQHSPLVFLAPKNSGIDTLHDLIGRRVALEEHSAELLAYLESEQIQTDQLDIVPHEFSVQKLLTGKVDAISAYSTDEPFNLLERDLSYNIFSPRSGGIDFYGDTLFTTSDYLEKNPETVSGFLSATKKGWKYALANPEEIIDLILKEISQRHSREHLLFEMKKSRRLILPDVVEIGYMNEGRWEHIIDTYRELGMIEDRVDLSGFIYDDSSGSNLAWFWRIIGFLLLLVGVIGSGVLLLLRINRRLQQEIREREAAEFKLRKSEEKHRIVVENATNLFYSHTPEHQLTYISPQCRQLLQCEPEEAIKRWTEFATDHPMNKIGLEITERAIKTMQVQPPYELELMGAAGLKRLVEVREKPLVRDGKVVAMVGSLTDITARKEVEKRIAESESRYRALFDHNPLQTIVVNAQGKISMYNRCLNFPELDTLLEGKQLFVDCLTGFDSDPTQELKRCLKKKMNKSLRGLRYDDRIIDMQISIFSAGAIITLNDVTESRRLQDMLEQMKKMKTVGTLSGGIAHEFNNILSIIMGNAELALTDLSPSQEEVNFIREIKLASIRGKRVVQQLLNFSHRKDFKKRALDLKQVISECILLLRASIPSSIIFNEHLQDADGIIMGDETEIHQVVINLASNAAHAMQGRNGELTFQLERVRINDLKPASIDIQQPGDYIRFTVSDTGDGIPEKILEHVFDPFFTTKPVDQGSGMGLSIVYGIIRGHDGYIHIESNTGLGTNVMCDFPISQNALSEPATRIDRVLSGNESILIVDDEVAIAKLLEMQLSRLGYRVLALHNPTEALDIFKADPEKFALVITDLAMPDLDGANFLRQIAAVNKHVKKVVLSGYSMSDEHKQSMTSLTDSILSKPIEIESLVQTVRDLLDRRME